MSGEVRNFHPVVHSGREVNRRLGFRASSGRYIEVYVSDKCSWTATRREPYRTVLLEPEAVTVVPGLATDLREGQRFQLFIYWNIILLGNLQRLDIATVDTSI